MDLEDRVSSFKISPAFDPISEVVVIVGTDSQGVERVYRAGNNTGRSIEIKCPWGTQAMANNLLTQMSGYIYQPYTANDALLDPALEIGDTIVINDTDVDINTVDATQDILYSANISSPYEEEIDHEYPYTVSGEMRESIRKTATITASLRIQMDSITSEVSDFEREVSSTIEQTADSITSTIASSSEWDTSAYQNITISYYGYGNPNDGDLNPSTRSGQWYLDKVDGGMYQSDGSTWTKYYTATKIQSSVSTVKQTADKINWIVASGTSSANFTLTSHMASLVADQIDLTGYVTIYDLQGTSTTINGSNITTGTINAKVGNLYADANHSKYLSLNSYGIEYYGWNEPLVDWWLKLTSDGVALGSNIYTIGITSALGAEIIGCDLYSDSDGSYNCGRSNHRWNNIYAATSTISTSDREKKTDINYSGLSGYDEFFDGLRPVTYRFKDGVRTHFGMISQDIEELINACDLDSNDVAAFIKSPIYGDDKETIVGHDYALRYEEFVPLLVKQVQTLKARVKVLEEK